jgi:hypothetical protein
LRRGGLPGELLQLYRSSGYKIDNEYYVLFLSRADEVRGYVAYAVYFVTLTIFLMLVCWMSERRLKRLIAEKAKS